MADFGPHTIIEPGEDDTIDELLRMMVAHSANYPQHGYNCACKDRVLSLVRRRLNFMGARSEFSYLASAMRR